MLSDEQLRGLDAGFPVLGPLRRPPPRSARGAEVVLLMGVPGAGKSRAAAAYVGCGYERPRGSSSSSRARATKARSSRRD